MNVKLFASLIIAIFIAASPSFAQSTDAVTPQQEFECQIKVGILHSLSGSMAISETPLKDTMLMLIADRNAAGGVMGCELVPVVSDPGSDWPTYATMARQMINVDEVAVIFGAWTSVSRKEILPVVEKYNGLLFYPVQYEGEESSANVFYTGAAPNQQAIPAADFMINELERDSFILLGTDYVYPRTANRILEGYLLEKGVASDRIFVNYTPFSHADWGPTVAYMKLRQKRGEKVGVISTINGDANIHFYKALADAGISAWAIPVMAFSVGEAELDAINNAQTMRSIAGHYAAWNYFQSVQNPLNESFVDRWRAYENDTNAVTNDPMEAHFIGFNLWVDAVEEVGTTDTDAVRTAMHNRKTANLSGGTATMLRNHHLTKPVLIGQIRMDGQFDVLKQTSLVAGDAWTDYLPISAQLVSDWSELKCGKYNTFKNQCVQFR